MKFTKTPPKSKSQLAEIAARQTEHARIWSRLGKALGSDCSHSETLGSPSPASGTSDGSDASKGLENPSEAVGMGPAATAAAPSPRGDPYLIHRTKAPTSGQVEQRQGLTEISRLPARLVRYGTAKRDGFAFGDYLLTEEFDQFDDDRKGPQIRGESVMKCGGYLEFKHWLDTGECRLTAADFCGQHLLCPVCAIRRAAKMMRSYVPKIVQVCREQQLLPYLVTVTVKDGPDLAERYHHLDESVRELMKRGRRARAGSRDKSTAAAAIGAVTSFEFKRGTGSGEWHPHAHSIWLCDTPPDQGELSREWHDLTGDSFVVDVRPINSILNFDDPGLTEEQIANSVADDIAEVFKYPLKFADLAFPDRWQAFGKLRGRRLIRPTGALWGVQLPDTETDELLPDDLPWVRLLFRWDSVSDSYFASEWAQKHIANFAVDTAKKTPYIALQE